MGYLKRHADEFNKAAPGAATNFYTTYLTTTGPRSRLRITCAFQNATIFNHIERKGTPAVDNVLALNGGGPLLAGAEYVFEIPVSQNTTHNFQIATNGIIRKLLVDEIEGDG
jgi:hypothetical protein